MGGALGRLEANGARFDRPLGWFDVHESVQAASGAGSAGLSFGASGSAGRTGGAAWSRVLGFASAGVHPASGPELQLRTLAGLVRGGGLLERFTVGGEEPPLYEPMLMAQQIGMPALNDAALVGGRLGTAQVRLGAAGGWLYGWLGRADETAGWQRVVGAEQELDTDAIPLLRVPGVHAVIGAGYTLDERPHRQVRLYGTATLRP